MTWEELNKVNGSLKITPVKDKPYVEVNERIKGFRRLFPEGTISTSIISLENGVVTMKAEVLDANGKLLATGLAQEKEANGYINKTSFIENCETSAVGRALGMLGIGIDTSVASADEVANAINNQSRKTDEQKNAEMVASVNPLLLPGGDIKAKQRLFKSELERTGIAEKIILDAYQVKSLEEMDDTKITSALGRFSKTPDKDKR